MCLYPKLVKNPKYLPTKKNRGVIPPFSDDRVLYVPIGCGKCSECVKQKARQWQTRLLEDIKYNKDGIFITLTFDEENLKKIQCELREKTKLPYAIGSYDLDNAVATYAVRRFLERWRKKYKKSLRHWLITELGHYGTERVHLHGIIWTKEPHRTIAEIWKYGFIWDGTRRGETRKNWINEQTVNYITKYITKRDLKHKEYQPKILTSAGIGRDYIKSHNATKNAL